MCCADRCQKHPYLPDNIKLVTYNIVSEDMTNRLHEARNQYIGRQSSIPAISKYAKPLARWGPSDRLLLGGGGIVFFCLVAFLSTRCCCRSC